MPNKWLEDFNKEVEEALSKLKAPRPRGVGPMEIGVPKTSDRLELSRLELALEELRRRLETQTVRLAAETKSRVQQQERLAALTAEIRQADDRTAALKRETSARSAHIKELEDTVESAEKARAKLTELLNEERANALHWREEAQALKARLESVRPALEKKEKELGETLARYDEICRSIKEETGQRLKEVRLLTSEAEKARVHEAEIQAQVDAQRRALEEERETLHAQAAQAMENAESIRRDAVQSLEEARALKTGAAPESPGEGEARRAREAESETLRRERARPEAPPQPSPRETQPEKRSPAGRYLILAGLLAAAAAAAVLAHKRPRSHAVPFSHPTALVWRGDALWASDWYDESVYRMTLEDGGLKPSRRYPLPGVHIAGMAIAGDSLYIVDSWSREIQRRKLDDALTLEASVRSPGTSPSALFYDGKYLWSADNSGAVYQHALDAVMSVLSSYPGSAPAVAIDADADTLWLADGGSRLLYAHRRDKTLTLIGAYGLKALDSGNSPLSCLARRGGKLWLGRDGSKFLLELPAGLLTRRPAPPRRRP